MNANKNEQFATYILSEKRMRDGLNTFHTYEMLECHNVFQRHVFPDPYNKQLYIKRCVRFVHWDLAIAS